jgi:pyruvate dehydrogenase E2 component (dihydrolipoamide acetyltransferase)
MERKFKITVEGRQYNVTVEELSDQNSLPYPEPGGLIASSVPLTSSFVSPAPAPAEIVTRGAAEPGDVVSPLNGVVESVLVTVGQQINEGDCALVVEAMKMKTPVTIKRAGTVANILVQAGDGVEAGQVLVKIA